ncbi:MAG TPA: hypothetical protein PK509_06205 [Catalimonadaceae bacterium]|nr:hypothetical protein [Catalimonadaceae bacterium]
MTISIPQPCTENWAQMMPVEKGRFCSRCAHSVRDFSGMKKEEALSEVEAALANGQRICGRFPTSWLQPQASVTPSLKRKSMYAWKWFGIILMWFQLESKAQLKAPVSKKPFYAFVIPSVTKANPEKDTVRKEEGFWVYGVVRNDETCEPVPFASIRVDQTLRAVADVNGFYRLFIPVALQKYGPKIIVQAASVGYSVNLSTLWISELGTSSEVEFNPFLKQREEHYFTLGAAVCILTSDQLSPPSRGLFHITKIVKPKEGTPRFERDSKNRNKNIFSRFFRFLLSR